MLATIQEHEVSGFEAPDGGRLARLVWRRQRQAAKMGRGHRHVVATAAREKAGVFAHGEAKVVARRIAERAFGTRPTVTFDGKGHCRIELGDGRASFAGGDFYAEPDPTIRT